MPSDLFKVATALFAFQKDGEISYSRRNASYLHVDESICDQCIQTLIDYKLIEFSELRGGVYYFKINEAIIEAARLSPLTDIPNKPLFRLSDEIKWKQQASTKEMDEKEIMERIRQLQGLLKKKVDPNADKELPW